MSDRIAGAAPSPGRLLAAAELQAGPAAKALDLLSIIVAAVVIVLLDLTIGLDVLSERRR